MLLVPLTAQRNEAQALRHGEIQQWPANSRQWRRLVILAPEAPKNPIQAREANSCAEPGTRRILGDDATEVRHARSGGQREPGERLVLIFEEERFQVTARDVGLRERNSRAVVRD